MLIPVRFSKFKRDAKRAERQGKNLEELHTLVALLIHQERVRRATKIIRYGEISKVTVRPIFGPD